ARIMSRSAGSTAAGGPAGRAPVGVAGLPASSVGVTGPPRATAAATSASASGLTCTRPCPIASAAFSVWSAGGGTEPPSDGTGGQQRGRGDRLEGRAGREPSGERDVPGGLARGRVVGHREQLSGGRSHRDDRGRRGDDGQRGVRGVLHAAVKGGAHRRAGP